MKITHLLALAFTVSLASHTLAAQDNDNANDHAKDNSELADQWMNYLASDERQGRLTGSTENTEVQSWLIERFKEIGLQKIPEQDSYLQKFTAHNRDG